MILNMKSLMMRIIANSNKKKMIKYKGNIKNSYRLIIILPKLLNRPKVRKLRRKLGRN